MKWITRSHVHVDRVGQSGHMNFFKYRAALINKYN